MAQHFPSFRAFPYLPVALVSSGSKKTHDTSSEIPWTGEMETDTSHLVWWTWAVSRLPFNIAVMINHELYEFMRGKIGVYPIFSQASWMLIRSSKTLMRIFGHRDGGTLPHILDWWGPWWSGWWFGTCYIFPYIGDNNPKWLIFFRGVQTTNQW